MESKAWNCKKEQIVVNHINYVLDFLLAQTTIRVHELNAHNFISLLNEIERIHSRRLIVTWRDRTRFTFFHKFTSLSIVNHSACVSRAFSRFKKLDVIYVIYKAYDTRKSQLRFSQNVSLGDVHTSANSICEISILSETEAAASATIRNAMMSVFARRDNTR